MGMWKFELAALILNEIVRPRLALIDVAKPCNVSSLAPEICCVLGSPPAFAFLASDRVSARSEGGARGRPEDRKGGGQDHADEDRP
jgi:hypothetical protein